MILNSDSKLVQKNAGRTKISNGLFKPHALYDFSFSEEGNVCHNKIQENNEGYKYLPNSDLSTAIPSL